MSSIITKLDMIYQGLFCGIKTMVTVDEMTKTAFSAAKKRVAGIEPA
jgi:hypothetical protein